MNKLLEFLQKIPPNYSVSIAKDMRMSATFKHNCILFIFTYYKGDEIVYKQTKAFDITCCDRFNYEEEIVDILEKEFKSFQMYAEVDLL